jgi:citronellol/citronellal dehydrogenase
VTVRTVATAAFIPDERGGKVTLIAPPPAVGAVAPSAAGVRAATENLARTLSIEWARHGIRTVAITPGPCTTDAELATLAAYLASPAGDYFSGCRLALGEIA